MTDVVNSPLTNEQISVWLRGLLSVAWADGHFDPEEQTLIADLTDNELAPSVDFGTFDPIDSQELGTVLGVEPLLAENFLRTAVMVALADGLYTASEDELLQQFAKALGQSLEPLEALRHTLADPQAPTPQPASTNLPEVTDNSDRSVQTQQSLYAPDMLRPVRKWLDGLEIEDPRVARFLCKMIPSQCPFERDVQLFGHKIVHIPPLCKLNPLYEQLVGLRFRALSYLADDCGEDVSAYV